MGKSKELSQDIRKTTVNLHKSSSPKCLKVMRSSVQTITRKHKHHGRRQVLCPKHEPKDLVKMLAEADHRVSLSTVKRVLHRHGLKGYSARKKSLSRSNIKKSDYSLQMHTGTKTFIFGDMSCVLIKLKLKHLAIMTIKQKKVKSD
uniref:Uncharacterized protein n=1 Tax=Amphiprion percula TaxID=161767 RepID=A0A3P8T6Q0_AMPPE